MARSRIRKTHIVKREINENFCGNRRDPSMDLMEYVSRVETNSIDLEAMCGTCRNSADDYARLHHLWGK